MGRLITGAMFGGVERCGHWTKAVAARPDNCTTIRQVRFDAEAINRHQEALSCTIHYWPRRACSPKFAFARVLYASGREHPQRMQPRRTGPTPVTPGRRIG